MGAVHELTGPFVGDAAIACQGGRCFTAFKPPGQQRNVLYEVDLTTWQIKLPGIGPTPGAYYKDGECDLCFSPSGELLMLNTCSPDPSTGGAARLVIWQTGIVVAAGASGVDVLARNVLKAIEVAIAPIP